jgi:hypothetical protein
VENGRLLEIRSLSKVTRIGGVLIAGFLIVAGCGDGRPNAPPGTGATGGAASGRGGAMGGTESGAAGDQAGADNGGSSANGGRGGRGGDGGASGGRASGGDGGGSGEAAGGGDGGMGGEAGNSGQAGGDGDAGTSGSGSGGTAGSGGGAAGSAGGVAAAAGSGGVAGAVDPGPDCVSGEKEICEITPGNHGGCFESIRICGDGVWGPCRPIPGEQTPGGEACNGEDEDCDGEIDEDLGETSCGIGACRNTVPACTNGVLGVCQPLAPQTDTDGCNGADDDCDGAVDENCPDCVHVAPDGNDESALASNGATPFRNVQPAIDFAALNGAARVCVAAGAACGASATFVGPTASDLTMQNGVSVLAGYESSGWMRCSNSTTTLAPTTARGVYFPPSVVNPTSLDGFVVARATATTTAGVTVEGGHAVTLSNLRILNSVTASNSYGVNLTNGAHVTIVGSRIQGGTATVESIGVRSVGSRVQIEDNCTSTDATTGRCGGQCTIRGAQGATSIGVALDDAPGSSIERSHVCAENGSHTIAGVRIRGDGSGVTLRGNAINGLLPRDDSSYQTSFAYGVELTECGGAAPWIVDNAIRVAPSFVREVTRGVATSGACHPVIEASEISAGTEPYGTLQQSAVIHCGSAAGVSSRCVIAGNRIAGIGGGNSTATSWSLTGIDCSAGGCAKISRNNVVARKHSGEEWCQRYCNADATALRIESGGPFVDRNEISLGCISSGVAVSLDAAWSRFQNNRVGGKSCPALVYERYQGERVLDVRATVEGLDIHSNTLSGGRFSPATGCAPAKSVVTWGGGAKRGMFRNNWALYNDTCSGRLFVEADTASDPAVLENNAFVPGATLYLDEAATAINTAAGLNGMTDIVCSGNILGDGDAIMQKDLGTPAGAPLWDFHGNARDETPSIGAVEP